MNFGNIVLILICLAIGYVLEPVFISDEKRLEASEDSASGETFVGGSHVELDLSKVTKADFPEEITLKVIYKITNSASGATMTFKEGSKVKPLSLRGNQLLIQPAEFPVKGEIHVDKTDFKSRTLPLLIARLEKGEEVAKLEPAPAQVIEPVVAAVVKQEPELMAEVESDPEPKEEPIDVVESEDDKRNEGSVIVLMKASVDADEVKEFNTNQVVEWKAGDEIEIDGVSYQTGIVIFKVSTILGVQRHEALAVIKDAAVHKWMWAKTKLEMR